MTPPQPRDRYWFARRFPVGHPRASVAPVSPEGWRVFWMFGATMVGGAVVWGMLAGLSLFFVGLIIFIAATIFAARRLFKEVAAHTDHQHTVEDYKAGRVPV